MKCIPKEIFEPQDYLDQLVCPLGKGFVRDPVALPCQHVFCKACIEEALSLKSVCPLCGEKANIEDTKPQHEVRELINMAGVHCPDCTFTGSYEDYEKHLVKCSAPATPCPQGCGALLQKQLLQKHFGECRLRRVECCFCKKGIFYQEKLVHEESCPEAEIECPRQCGSKMKKSDTEEHLKICPSPATVCKYADVGCYFNPTKEAAAKTVEDHCKASFAKHLGLLGSALYKLKTQVDVLSDASPHLAKGIKPSLSDVLWNNGKKVICGSKATGWSFFLSNKMIQNNFVARIRLLALGKDQNSWKMCFGLFNSDKFHAGSWDKHKNGWGYILGTGHAIHDAGPRPYGEAYGAGDIISVEHSNGNISFSRNGKSQGVAFAGTIGPFYLAVGLSDAGHTVEIVDVVET